MVTPAASDAQACHRTREPANFTGGSKRSAQGRPATSIVVSQMGMRPGVAESRR